MKVRGTQEKVLEIEVGKTLVFLRSNIVKLESEDFKGWEYDEEQILKDEFIARLQNENANLKDEVMLLQEVTFDAVVASEETKAELLNLQELVFNLIVSQEGVV